MHKRLSFLLLSVLMLASCQKDSGSETAVQETPVAGRPIVAVVPFIDHSDHGLSWNVADELTKGLYVKLLEKHDLYLMNHDKVMAALKKLSSDNDPFGTNLSWVKRAFAGSEFVVFTELAQHEEVPEAGSDSAAELQIALRVRVIDLRGQKPQIILQEVVRKTEHVARPFTKANFTEVPWGDEMFEISPLGMTHASLTKELASRIDDYILSSK
ncbi:MAG: hypothetical protein JSR58_07570 [Verrucomicrobia bacterium]|nr:hypothetical protein [Verrucomicrobiota bacterium]